jgi:hypothetical protein
MNDRHPYNEDPYGRRPSPPGRPEYPAPRAGSGNWNGPSPGESYPAPPPGPGPRQPARPRPGPDSAEERNGFPAASDWEDENTRMIGKLGYVPPEARHIDASEEFDTENVTAADRVKYRSRKRAKKASPLVKIGVIAAVVVVVAGLGGGIWWLASGEDEAAGSQLTYEAVDKPCTLLDLDSLQGVSGADESKEMRNETETKQHKSEQICEVTLGKDGSVGSVQVYAEVFPRDAGASNAFEHGQDDAKESTTENVTYDKVAGLADGAFSVSRVPSQDSETVDYSLYLHHDNAYLYTRVSLYKGTTPEDAAGYAKAIAEDYLAGWRG